MRTEINAVTGEITEHEDYDDYGQYVTPADKNKSNATMLLNESDWASNQDVGNSNNVTYLANADEYITYRGLLRNIAINPTEGDLDWPIKPIPQWITN